MSSLAPAASAATSNPLARLHEFGQSVWLDYIRRSLLTSGELKRLLSQDGLRGITSNPAIFAKAITGSGDYKEPLRIAREHRLSAIETYESLAIEDVRLAARTLRPLYRESNKRDGYVSLEVSPYLAHNFAATVKEARRLWGAVEEPNLMIKVPATPEGIEAVGALIAEGLNINVTLIFSLETYERVAEAFISGLESRQRRGKPIEGIASVASFFISRIDAAVDPILSARLQEVAPPQRPSIESVLGKTAIANAKLAYARYQQLYSSARWQSLAGAGAQSQRLLWASTGMKNPRYRDTLYVEELIGQDTVNTIPPATYDAFRAHGRVGSTLTQEVSLARETIEALEHLGISMGSLAERLLDEGLSLFQESFDKLLSAADSQCKGPVTPLGKRQVFRIGEALQQALSLELRTWISEGKSHRLWGRDATLWTNHSEGQWLGWLNIIDEEDGERNAWYAMASLAGKFAHVVLLGMGGSSLAPEVFHDVFAVDAPPTFHVLDSTDPAQVLTLTERVDVTRALFIVSSKSGSTLEPNIFEQYFYAMVEAAVGLAEAPKRFVVITDPDSALEKRAVERHFNATFHGVPSIGGRYSALSNFGILPAAAMAIDVAQVLDRARDMMHACASCVSAAENPGVMLGILLGVAARAGRDKLTIVSTPRLRALGAWLEQLIAESTGKQGRGIIPIDGESLSSPKYYGNDRLFVSIALKGEEDRVRSAALKDLELAGHPVIEIQLDDIYDLGQEFFRWEFATAVAGTVLAIDPFDQPDVEASKITTRELISSYERDGRLPREEPLLVDNGIEVYADVRNARELLKGVKTDWLSLESVLQAHLARAREGDYVTFLAYVERNAEHTAALQRMRLAVRDARHVATCVGFGPRFLHSTGQAYKGGPNTSVVIQLTCEDAKDVSVPGGNYSFGVVKAAQARGDFKVLVDRERRALRVHLTGPVEEGLDQVERAIRAALY
jgi:transaldolase / glucose-6-phosphate isomerase